MSDATEAANRLAGNHPMRYRADGEVWKRCPACEQWSPCDVRVLMDRVDPAAGYLTDETMVEIP